jgi:hypothetical protein
VAACCCRQIREWLSASRQGSSGTAATTATGECAAGLVRQVANAVWPMNLAQSVKSRTLPPFEDLWLFMRHICPEQQASVWQTRKCHHPHPKPCKGLCGAVPCPLALLCCCRVVSPALPPDQQRGSSKLGQDRQLHRPGEMQSSGR